MGKWKCSMKRTEKDTIKKCETEKVIAQSKRIDSNIYLCYT